MVRRWRQITLHLRAQISAFDWTAYPRLIAIGTRIIFPDSLDKKMGVRKWGEALIVSSTDWRRVTPPADWYKWVQLSLFFGLCHCDSGVEPVLFPQRIYFLCFRVSLFGPDFRELWERRNCGDSFLFSLSWLWGGVRQLVFSSLRPLYESGQLFRSRFLGRLLNVS